MGSVFLRSKCYHIGMVVGNNNAIEEIKAKLDIADVVGRYVQLKRLGTNFRGLCPFHGEKTPSFYVTPSRQIWHCFGCGEGGDVISFVQKREHLEFREALEMLAEQAGVELPTYSKGTSNKNEKEGLLKIAAFAAEFYHRSLFGTFGGPALKYLKERGLSLEVIKNWQIGLCPEDGQALSKALTKHKVRPQELASAGLYAQNDKGFFYDRFRSRITFPIRNPRGQVVAFSARIFNTDRQDLAKYVNSSDSLIYHKSDVLFGFFEAKDAIVKLGESVVVEGQMDCISCHVAGFSNVVAPCGTALTEGHVKALSRLAETIIFCFDADLAGRSALLKAAKMAISQGVKVFVIDLVGYKDPDEMVRKDPQLWKESMKNKRSIFAHYIAKAQLVEDPTERQKFVKGTVLELLKLVTDPLEREMWERQVSQVLGLSLANIQSWFEGENLPAHSSTFANLGGESERQREQLLVAGASRFPQIRSLINELGIEREDFSDASLSEAFFALEKGETNNPTLLEASFVLELIQEQYVGGLTEFLSQLVRSVYLFKLSSMRRAITNLTIQLRQVGVTTEQALEIKTKINTSAQKRVGLEKALAKL